MVLAARAFVVLAKGRVSADHQEILAGGQALMPCAGRQDGDVAGFQGIRHRSISRGGRC
jgi:hypothetical protein